MVELACLCAEDATVAQPSPEKAEGSSADAVEEQPTAGEADVKDATTARISQYLSRHASRCVLAGAGRSSSGTCSSSRCVSSRSHH
eukprot:830566-Amphidinium_carterae.1